MSRTDEAFDVYDSLLFTDDRTLNANNVRGHIHYALGELYRDAYNDFSYAAAHFDTSKSALTTLLRSGRTGAAAQQLQFAPEAITDSERQAQVFGSFAKVYDKIAHIDSLLWLGHMEQGEFDEFILDLRRKRAEEMVAEQREIARRQAEQGFQNISTTSSGSQKVIPGPYGNQGSGNDGFLFYKSRAQVQESRIAFISLWGDRPHMPNWRRLDAIQNANTITAEGDSIQVVSDKQIASILDENMLPEGDYSDVPRTQERIGEVEGDLALVRYELANVLFLSMERPDSAAAWYRLVIDEAHQLPVAQRAYYALAEVNRALGDSESASRLYNEVVANYPDSDFANQARERLGLPPVIVQNADSVSRAEEAYARAYERWKNKRYEEAVSDMVMLASTYPVPDVASKALLATGSIYLEWAEEEDLDLRALPLPMVPDSILWSNGLVDSTTFQDDVPADAATAGNAAQIDDASAGSLLPGGISSTDPAFRRAGKMMLDADSLQLVSERLYSYSVSLYVLSDTLYGAADKQALSDSLYAISEAAQLRSDSLLKAAESLRTQGRESLGQLGVGDMDSARLRKLLYPSAEHAKAESRPRHGRYVKLEGLFANIKEKFPRSPHAEFADKMLRAMVEMRPVEDSTIVQELVEEDIERTVEDIPEDEKFIRLPGEMDITGEGWTLIVGSFNEEDRAQLVVEEYKAKGLKSAVLRGGTRFRVGVGQFPDLDTARAGLAKFKDELPPTTWFLDIQKVR